MEETKRIAAKYDAEAKQPPVYIPMKIEGEYMRLAKNLPNTAQFIPVLVQQHQLQSSYRCYLQ